MKFLIIGNSAAAVGAIEAIRRVDKKSQLTVVSDEPHFTYSRPLISEFLAGSVKLERMAYRASDFYDRYKVKAVLGQKAVGLDLDQKQVKLAGGRKLAYDKLLIATGGKPFVPPIKGADQVQTFTFTKLDDANRLLEEAKKGSRFVIIGAGLIGLKAAESLHGHGVDLTVVELADRIMANALDERAALMVRERLEAVGIKVRTGLTVAEVLGENGKIQSVKLTNDELVPCDNLIVAIGVVPNLDLVKDSGVKINRGIIVDDYMRTSETDVYAAGDVVEGPDMLQGVHRVIPIWPNAYTQGKVAGQAMAGEGKKFPGGVAMNSIELFGLPVVSVGQIIPPDDTYEVITRVEEGVYRKIVLKDGCAVGAVFVGHIERAGLITGLIKDKVNVEDFKDQLLLDTFGFVCLPDELRRERLALKR